jgi:ribonuclease HII
MVELHPHFPAYDFAQHKGYITPEHSAALRRHGPCPEHRFSYINVARAAGRVPADDDDTSADPCPGERDNAAMDAVSA